MNLPRARARAARLGFAPSCSIWMNQQQKFDRPMKFFPNSLRPHLPHDLTSGMHMSTTYFDYLSVELMGSLGALWKVFERSDSVVRRALEDCITARGDDEMFFWSEVLSPTAVGFISLRTRAAKLKAELALFPIGQDQLGLRFCR